MIDCLANTGAEGFSVPWLLPVGLFLAGIVILWWRSKRDGAAGRTTVLGLILILGFGMTSVGVGQPAQATVDCDTSVVVLPTPEPSATVPEPTVLPLGPTPTPTTAPTTEPPVAGPDYAIGIPSFTLPYPPSAGDFAVRVPATISNLSSGQGNASVTVMVPAETSGYWTVSDVLNTSAQRDPALSFTVQPDGSALISVASRLAPDSEFLFLIELTYNFDSWDHEFIPNPDGSACRMERPVSSITLRLGAEVPVSIPANGVAVAALPGSSECYPPP